MSHTVLIDDENTVWDMKKALERKTRVLLESWI